MKKGQLLEANVWRFIAVLLLRNKEQSARKFRNLPPLAKERTWANCNLITAWYQNSEPGSCAVSDRQINYHCNN